MRYQHHGSTFLEAGNGHVAHVDRPFGYVDESDLDC